MCSFLARSLSSATEISRPFASQEDFDDNLEAVPFQKPSRSKDLKGKTQSQPPGNAMSQNLNLLRQNYCRHRDWQENSVSLRACLKRLMPERGD